MASFGDDAGFFGPGDSGQLAFLPAAKRDALRRITQDYDEMMAKFSAGGVQLASDKEKLRLLRAERESDIAALLTPEERLVMQEHSRVGFELLDGLNLEPLDSWVLHHHEHWDGGGYPAGLAGAEIPFGSRILHVADAFDAMTSSRPYRGAISVEGALGELREFAGRQFDPLVVAALESCLAAEPPRVPTAAAANANAVLA